MEGKENDPMVLPANCWLLPFCVVFTVLTPGVKFSNCVKFRPFKGRLSTDRLPITVPSSELDVWILVAEASTTTASVAEPMRKVTSIVVPFDLAVNQSTTIA